MSAVLDLACALVARPSVTPEDAGCQPLIAGQLATAGFRCEALRFGVVDNLWATHGNGPPTLILAGHTDVVPPGPIEAWRSDPFLPTLRDGCLYGRGAADMKGSLAAMVVAAQRFVARHPTHPGTLAFLLTSDEEGPAIDGTVRVVERLQAEGRPVEFCVVGEPSSEARLGDVVKNGRRGSLNGHLVVEGIQGHVAYPHRARNPVHEALPALAELVATRWDAGNADFPPTSLQISNLGAGTGADNVIPGRLDLLFNFRFSTVQSPERLMRLTEAVLRRHGVHARVDWRLSGMPFLTAEGALLEATRRAVRAVTGGAPRASTGGGTSDGRFIARLGAEVVELGPRNASIHQANECVAVDELEALVEIHERLLTDLLAG